MTWIENVRPTLKSIGIAMVFLNMLVVAVGAADVFLQANYMFLLHKPDSASILDWLGPYPYYLISEEIMALVLFFVMLLPFGFGKSNVNVSGQKG